MEPFLLTQPVVQTEPDSDLSSSVSSCSPPPCSPPPCSPLRPPLGSLHLEECSEERFFSLNFCDVGRYELIDGVLAALPMASGRHGAVVDKLSANFNEKKRVEVIRSKDAESAVLASHHFVKDPTVKIHCGHCLIPDWAIGKPHLDGGPAFGPENLPEMVGEVTSTNGRKDLSVKEDDFVEIGVPYYVIVDLKIDKHKRVTAPAAVYIGKLVHGHYKFKHYRSGQQVAIPLIGSFDVDEILNPTSPTKDIVKFIEEDKKRYRDALAQVTAHKERADKQQERADKHKEKSRRRKEKLRAAGFTDSSSSSGSAPSSPACKKLNANIF